MMKYDTDLQARYRLTLEEAREIVNTNGLGYSTTEFVQALQVIEEHIDLIEKQRERYTCWLNNRQI